MWSRIWSSQWSLWLWELGHKKSRVTKNWSPGTVVMEKTPEGPLDSKETKPVNHKWDQPWIFTGRTDAEAEVPIFWSSNANTSLIGKIPDAEKDWEQKEKRASEDEVAAWHHRCNECELVQALGDGEGQGGPVCYRPWGCKELDTTERLNNNNDSMTMHDTNVLSIGLYTHTTVPSIGPYSLLSFLLSKLYSVKIDK